jgi:hypothetical protein
MQKKSLKSLPKLKEKDIRSLKAAMARKSLTSFVEYVLRDENGDTVRAAPHQIAWDQHISYSLSIRKIPLILAPMAHGKTQWLAVAAPLYFLGLNENFRITIVSSAEKIASERLETVGRYIERSSAYQEVFPWIKPDYTRDWNKNRINVVRGLSASGEMVGSVNSSIAAYGYTSREGIGSRSDILIFDDVVDESNSVISPASRDNLKRMVTTQWITRTEPKPLKDRFGNIISPGPIIIAIGTRYHEEDLYADWLNTPSAYCSLVQGVSEDFGYLDVEIVGAERVPPHPVHEAYASWAL